MVCQVLSKNIFDERDFAMIPFNENSGDIMNGDYGDKPGKALMKKVLKSRP
jgi:hypothetical protein